MWYLVDCEDCDKTGRFSEEDARDLWVEVHEKQARIHRTRTWEEKQTDG
jgi:hypothetical protein